MTNRWSYGLGGVVISWFTSYLIGRTQYVRSSASSSKPSEVLGSVLGPILFLLYTADVLQLVKSHQLSSHAYADDTQIYGFCRPSDIDALRERISVCTDDVISWMMANRLPLPRRRYCGVPQLVVSIRSQVIQYVLATHLPVSVVRDLWFYLDADQSMRAHITATVRTCFAALCDRSVVCAVH